MSARVKINSQELNTSGGGAVEYGRTQKGGVRRRGAHCIESGNDYIFAKRQQKQPNVRQIAVTQFKHDGSAVLREQHPSGTEGEQRTLKRNFQMHTIARENLQHFLYAYKESPKEPGLRLIHDAKQSQAQRKDREHQHALKHLRAAVRYSSDWWIGRVVAAETTIGFIPTARRLARLIEQNEEEQEKAATEKNAIVTKQAEIWEYPNPYTVVPSTRPIILLGPCYQSSRLTQLMHAAVRSAIVKKFGSRVRRLTTDIGDKGSSKLTFDINERELRLITAMTEDLHLVLLECPNISTPADVAQLNMAPIMFLFRISNRKILLKLLKKTGIKGGNAVAGADALNQLTPDLVDIIIEDNGLHEATKKIFKFLEAYWLALHPTTPILEEEYLEKGTNLNANEEAHYREHGCGSTKHFDRSNK
ncbi:hypothetical protein RB195_005771 [Necator americanus]|uniref:Dihydropyridine sensitive L-type calcium channel n=1 Tax=Necator americanus TaxID=51031 RepID=A0ABR1BSM8_NECAM